MRYFFRLSNPPVDKILLVESGSRYLYDRLIPILYQIYGDAIEIDLVTCFAGEPSGFHGTVFRVSDYSSPTGRKQLLAKLLERNYRAIGIICAAEPVMTKWKWWLAWKIPAKFFIVNENCDFFWFDRTQWRTIVHFVLFRAGLTGAAAVPAIARFLFFPFTLAYLLLFAATVHLKRWIRLRITP